MKGKEALAIANACGRKFLQCMLISIVWWVPGAISFADQAPRLEVELNNTSTPHDDYFCWTPVPARIRIAGGTERVSVVLSSRSTHGGGEVVFQSHDGGRPASSGFSPKRTITLALRKDGSWTPFWIAGSKASTEGKDTEVVVTGLEDGTELASIPLMIRVRKDASALNLSEISRFLKALRTHHNLGNQTIASKYVKYAEAHEKASDLGIHLSFWSPYPPLFLAWHRALLLSVERELQAIDPAVSIPYWRFDRDDATDPAIFSVDFMGTVEGGDPVLGKGTAVQFSQQNPLNGWVVGDGTLLARTNDGTEAIIPPGRLQMLLEARTDSGELIHASYADITGVLERRYHNGAHAEVGGTLGRFSSPGDPLFFLLHANVDRAWAMWQHANPVVRFDPTHVDAYPAQGSYPGMPVDGKELFRMGSYTNDPMWPWAGFSGDQNNEDPDDDWPEMRFDMPLGPGVGGVSSRPTPAKMIDYLDVRGTGSGTGACYDHLTF